MNLPAGVHVSEAVLIIFFLWRALVVLPRLAHEWLEVALLWEEWREKRSARSRTKPRS